MRVERIGLDEWARTLPDAGFEVFHHPDALAVLAEHAPGTLQLYGGFKSDRPVGLFPVFVRRYPVGRVVQSPPPGLGVPRLGPLVMPASPKRRKRERVNREFVTGVLDALDVDARDTLARFVCGTHYPDPRPFAWADLGTETLFTYSLDLADGDLEATRRSFSRSLRREIDAARDRDLDVRVEGVEGVRAVWEATRDRYAEQDRDYGRPWPYVRALATALDDRCRAYVARTPDGEYAGGLVVLYSNDAAYYWAGGTRDTHEDGSANALLHWRVIEDVVEDPPVAGVHRYDLLGANVERLARYKAKFGADLRPYYAVETQSPAMTAAKRAYRLVAR